jgi:hypothetical protein
LASVAGSRSGHLVKTGFAHDGDRGVEYLPAPRAGPCRVHGLLDGRVAVIDGHV